MHCLAVTSEVDELFGVFPGLLLGRNSLLSHLYVSQLRLLEQNFFPDEAEGIFVSIVALQRLLQLIQLPSHLAGLAAELVAFEVERLD